MPGKKVLRREFFLCDSFIISDWLAAHYDNFFDFTYSWFLASFTESVDLHSEQKGKLF